MRVFIWHQIRECSGNYHANGGVVVFAQDEARAREIANAVPGCAIKPTEHPDEARDCADGPERVYIMPDAGCC